MQKRWFIKQRPTDETIHDLETALKVSPVMATLLAQRSLTTHEAVRSFFNPPAETQHDPFLMKNMPEAVERLNEALKNGEKVLVFGDYDVDGTTAVALVYSVIKEHFTSSFYIPDRYEEGYGLSYQGIDTAHQRGATLIIALDCGIKEIDKIAYARSLGITVIVCDHHTPGEVLPDAIILDPKQTDCTYPYKELCGCGVGYKLMQAWYASNDWNAERLNEFLDLVAIAIGADIVPVSGENRFLCKEGLKRLNEEPRTGIHALLKHAGKSLSLMLSDVVFTIAPRINAAGRLESGMRSVELLLCENAVQADEIAAEIDVYNTNRRALDAQMTGEALEMIAVDPDFNERKSTVVYHHEWHKGVVGIVASRLIEHHYRPTVVLTESKGVATGSARSVEHFNVYEAIASCEHLLTQYGGHFYAAGLTMPVENVPAFRDAFDEIVRMRLPEKAEMQELTIDMEVQLHQLFLAGESVGQLPRLYRMLEQMEPFGPQNDKPVFCVRGVYASSYRILKEAHLRVDLMDAETGVVLPAIGFNMADKTDLIASGCAFDCAFTLEANTWNGRTTLQLQMRDIREHGY